MQITGIEKLRGFKGFIIDTITFSPEVVQYKLHRDKRRKMICPNCCRNMSSNKPITRTVSDLPIGTARCVKITFETQQGKCSCGHTKTFLPDEVEEKATATKRLKRYASELCRFMTASEVSHLLPFSDDTIRRLDKEVLEKQLGNVDLSDVKRLLIDEKLQYGSTNAAMERFNGTVARVIARGFGYKDERYLFLKLRQQSKNYQQTRGSTIFISECAIIAHRWGEFPCPTFTKCSDSQDYGENITGRKYGVCPPRGQII